MYYGADGKLRAVENRSATSSAGTEWPYTLSFEEYKYDPLGRRIWVHTRQKCGRTAAYTVTCSFGTVRRTVWDGDAELYEIQMPDDQEQENDVAVVTRLAQTENQWFSDPNVKFGRVGYTYGLALDQPLSLTRLNYRDTIPPQTGQNGQGRLFPPLSLVPYWDWRGIPDLGGVVDGGGMYCVQPTWCVRVRWQDQVYAYRPSQAHPVLPWWGTLIEDKSEASGLQFRRNRYVDPATGRFTQEDPIGLAGGVNLYGFAAGDPVNLSDPFGLCPACSWAKEALRRIGSNLKESVLQMAEDFATTPGAFIVPRRLGRFGAASEMAEMAEMSGAMRQAAAGRGNFGIGSFTAEQANAMGEAWVGAESRAMSEVPGGLVSADGLRTYRPPTMKANGKVQANLEQYQMKPNGNKMKIGNAHVDIVPQVVY